MRIARFEGPERDARIGMIVPVAGADHVLDFDKAVTAQKGGVPFDNTMTAFIETGREGLDIGYNVIDWAMREGAPEWFEPLANVRWLVPTTPRVCLCAGRNFGRHRDESVAAKMNEHVASGFQFEFPTGFVKLSSTLVPHKAEVACPEDVKEFDYEIEVAAVMGKHAGRISEEKALEAVFGYTVFNDLSAREWQRKEMRNQMILISKNFPGFGPIGPWILTADEIADPSTFVIELKVNGEVRQRDSCADMIFDFPQLVSFWSRAGLESGDVIASGTPGGVATHRKPDPFPYYLRAGDVVEASASQIGVLETRITDA
jgi:2-keto-4-pentenoate hydratase/2-oxohepta-3-ene-1,7-dioic acid hydratase in catechol pathway